MRSCKNSKHLDLTPCPALTLIAVFSLLDVKSAAGETFASEQSRRKILCLASCSSGGEEACTGGEGGDSKKLSHAIPAAGKARCHAIPVQNSCNCETQQVARNNR